ncbi:hypothetical protein ACFX12_013505 [Malus domestica]
MRHFAPEQAAIIEAEIKKLLKARFIKEVAHSGLAARKLIPYFQGHPIIVMTQPLLRSVLHNPDTTQ